MPNVEECPVCGSLWFKGKCYDCGAYMENGKMTVPKPETPIRPSSVPPEVPEDQVPPKKSMDDGEDPDFE